MIHKVEISNDVGQGMRVTQHFEAVVDTEEEAAEFGNTASTLFSAFLNAWDMGDES